MAVNTNLPSCNAITLNKGIISLKKVNTRKDIRHVESGIPDYKIITNMLYSVCTTT